MPSERYLISSLISCQPVSVAAARGAPHDEGMRPARLSLSSLVLGTFPLVGLVACTLDGGSSPSSCGDGYAGYDCSYPSGYGGSSGGYGYDSGSSAPEAPSADCTESFAFTMNAPKAVGDCKLTLSAYGSSDASIAVYYFAAPAASEVVRCEALEGPLPGRCVREVDVVAFGSTTTGDVAALRRALGMTGSTFSASLSCTSNYPTTKEVSITCGSSPTSPPPFDAGGGTDDAGPGSPPGPDAGPILSDGGCGP
jgi:hypothetical protein